MRQDVQEKLAAARAKGIVFLVLQHVLGQFVDRLRREHPWMSVAVTPLDMQVTTLCFCLTLCSCATLSVLCPQLRVTRPQRIVTLCAVMLTSMAVNAMFFGKSKD